MPPCRRPFLKKISSVETDALRNLEQEYFHSFFRKAPLAESVHVVACPSLQEEIRFAAGKILRLVREEGLRFRQIAIVTNAMETYEKSLRGILEEYDLPALLTRAAKPPHTPLSPCDLSVGYFGV